MRFGTNEVLLQWNFNWKKSIELEWPKPWIFFFFFRKTNAKQKGFHPFELFLPTIIQWVYNLYWFSLNGSAFANKTKMPNGPFRSRHFTTFEKPSTLAQVCECVMSKHEYCLNVHESLIVCRNKKQEMNEFDMVLHFAK